MLGGNPTSTSPAATNLLYSGEQFDTDLQQYYLRARYYDQNNGRFNRTDPYAGNSSDPQSLHKYLYCHANPVNGIDPSGMMMSFSSLSIGFMVAGLIVGIAGLTMIGVGYSTKNSLLKGIGVDLVVLGISLFAGGIGIAGAIVTATEAAVLSSITTGVSIMYQIIQSKTEKFVTGNIGLKNQIRNMILSSENGIPSHGIIIFRDRANSLVYCTGSA